MVGGGVTIGRIFLLTGLQAHAHIPSGSDITNSHSSGWCRRFFFQDIDIIRDFSRNYESAVDWDRYLRWHFAMITAPPKALKAALPNAVVKVPVWWVWPRSPEGHPKWWWIGRESPPKQAISFTFSDTLNLQFVVDLLLLKITVNAFLIEHDFYSWSFYFQHIAKILVVDDSISKGTYLSMEWALEWVGGSNEL